MSVDALETQVKGFREEAKQVGSRFGQEAKAIDQNANLSDEGKKAAKAEVNSAARDSLRALSQKESDAINMKVRDLEKAIDSKMGNTATDIIAFRDAQDRAEKFDSPDEATRVLERAIRSEDTVLAHAIFRRAIDSDWRKVIDMFGNEYPDKKDIVNDLSYLKEAQRNTMGRTMQYAWFNV